jgi:Flp pilus assembly protein TadG
MRLRRLRGLAGDRSGAGAVEFALVLGPLVFLILGAMEYGRLLWTKQALQEAAIAGARCMGVLATGCASGGAYSASNTTSYIQGVASGLVLTVPSAGVTLNRAASCAGVSGFSSVTLSYTFQAAVPVLLGAGSSAMPLTATACFPNNA